MTVLTQQFYFAFFCRLFCWSKSVWTFLLLCATIPVKHLISDLLSMQRRLLRLFYVIIKEISMLLESLSKRAERFREKKEAEINMCTALEKLKDEGRQEMLLTLIQKKLAKGFSIPEIADMLEEPEEEIRRILKETDTETA